MIIYKDAKKIIVNRNGLYPPFFDFPFSVYRLKRGRFEFDNNYRTIEAAKKA